MSRISALVAAGALGTALAVAAPATAAPGHRHHARHSSAPHHHARVHHRRAHSAAVKRHLRNADRALEAVVAGRGSDDALAGAVHRLVSQEASAQRIANHMARRASQARPRKRASHAAIRVARSRNHAVHQLTTVLGQAPDGVQPVIAGALSSTVTDRQQVLAKLGQLAEQLPEPARSVAQKFLAKFASQTPGELSDIGDLLGGGSLTQAAIEPVSQALQSAVAAVKAALAQVTPLIGDLPAPVGKMVQGAVAQVPAVLDDVSNLVNDILKGVGGMVDGATHGSLDVSSGVMGIMGSVERTVGDILHQLPIIGGMFGGHGSSQSGASQTGSSGSGSSQGGPSQGGSSGASSSSGGGLLGGLFGDIPFVGNLLNGLFGGLLGGLAG